MKLSDYVVRFIAEQGVKHVFLVTGGGAMHLNQSLGTETSIEPVCNSHEQASAMCAEAYAKVTNHLGVCMVTTGPGGFFDEHSVVILQCARALADYGVEPRHLRAFRSAADRQSDLIAQIAGPVVKAGKAGARDRADDLAREVAALAITLHTSLIKSAVRDVLHR